MAKRKRIIRRKIKSCKLPIAKLQRKLWVYCRMVVRKIYGNECYTCSSKNLEGRNWQTGHLIPKATCGAYLKYDIRVLRPQCSNCNIWNGGRGADFLKNMIEREGQEYVDKIFQDRNLIIKPYDRYMELLENYKKILS